MYADIGRETWRAEEKRGSDAVVCPVVVDLTRPFKKNPTLDAYWK
jgi:hypothetical protein